MSDKPKLAVVETISTYTFRDVAKTLREIADKIEAGKYGEVDSIAMVMHTSENLSVFGIGEGDVNWTNTLLDGAKAKLTNAFLAHCGGYQL